MVLWREVRKCAPGVVRKRCVVRHFYSLLYTRWTATQVKQDICHTPEKPFNRFLNLYTESIISGSSELKHKQKYVQAVFYDIRYFKAWHDFTRSSLELERNARDSHIKLEVSQPAGSRTLITAQPKEAVAETQKIQPERSSPEMVVSRGFRNSPSNTGTGPLSEVTITNDQSLHGVVVSGEEIDDMFKLLVHSIRDTSLTFD